MSRAGNKRDIVEEQKVPPEAAMMSSEDFESFFGWKASRAGGASRTVGRKPRQPEAAPTDFGAVETPIGGRSDVRSGYPREEAERVEAHQVFTPLVRR